VQIDGKQLPLPQLQYKKPGPAGTKKADKDVAKQATWNLRSDVHFYQPGTLDSFGVAIFGYPGKQLNHKVRRA
jgi:hypothetical protein